MATTFHLPAGMGKQMKETISEHQKEHEKEQHDKIHILKHTQDFVGSLIEASFNNDWLMKDIKTHDFAKIGLTEKEAKKYKKWITKLHKIVTEAVEEHQKEFGQVEKLWVKNQKQINTLEE
jgi:hypothetical protein